MNRSCSCNSVFVVNTLFLLSTLLTPSVLLFAQEDVNTTLASSIAISGEAHDGDIISYNASTDSYTGTRVSHDPSIFGVIVDDPVLYMHDPEPYENARPVVRFGEALVNVSTLNGEVKMGDLVTSSHIIGVGQRVSREDATFILGFAIGSMVIDERSASVTIDGNEVRFGKVPVALRIGYYADSMGDLEDDLFATLTSASVDDDEGAGLDVFKLFRYILGAFVAISAVILALRRFGDLFAQSVISVGRNPLARSQIRSILIWNAVLIVIVSSVGLSIGIAIILVP